MNFVGTEDEDSPDVKSLSRQKLIEAQLTDIRNSGYEDEEILNFDFEDDVLTDNVAANEKMVSELQDTALETQLWRQQNKMELEQKIIDAYKDEDVSSVNDSNFVVDETPESELLLTPRSADEAYRRLQTLIKNATEEHRHNASIHTDKANTSKETESDSSNGRIKARATNQTPRGSHSKTYELPSEEALRRELFDLEILSIQQNVRHENLAARIQQEGDMMASQTKFENNVSSLESNLRDFSGDLDKLLGL
jgi:hypothetical protein